MSRYDHALHTIQNWLELFPDAAAAERGRVPQHCYSVRFDARELWGPEAPARDAIYIDLFEPYLEPA